MLNLRRYITTQGIGMRHHARTSLLGPKFSDRRTIETRSGSEREKTRGFAALVSRAKSQNDSKVRLRTNITAAVDGVTGQVESREMAGWPAE